jgi:polyisoprenyl-phosphate glycosyltransferase
MMQPKVMPLTRLPLLSVVVPCHNEEPVLRETHRRLTEVLQRLPGMSYEVIYIDDGSRDTTAQIMRELQSTDANVRCVLLSRNFGHQIAVTAGIEHARGDAVVLIDADLQDPPETILEFVARWRQGFEVAYGVRTQREGETHFKRWSASIFYRLLNRLSDVAIPLDTGDFRLMDRRVVDTLIAMPERDRFVRGMVSWVGFRQTAVGYRRAARLAGESKYPFWKMVRFATDGILSFSQTPLRIAIWMGFTVSALSLLGIAYAVMMRLLTSIWVPGWTLLFIAVLFLGGVQLISLGIIGEYVGRIYGETKRRPLYIAQERLGFEPDPPQTSPS